MTIVYFILILGITVFIHELGHFLCAKKFGVYVYEFSIGMGPRLFKFNRKGDETDYCIRLFPIGGFVQMAGEEIDVDEKIPEGKRLQAKPAFQRFLIMVAGVMMNFLLAIVILFFIGLFNKVTLNNVYVAQSTVSGLDDGSKIVAINNNFVNNYDKLSLELIVAGKKNFTMTVKDANGVKKDVSITPIEVGKSNLIYGNDYGFDIEAGLKVANSKVNGLDDGVTIVEINGKVIDEYHELLIELNNIKDKNFTMKIKDDANVTKDIVINVSSKDKDQLTGYSYGFYLTGNEESGFFAAIKYSFLKFFSSIEQMIFTVFYLIIGKISLSMLSGPVGIFNAVSVYSSYGFTSLLSLLALICINVGFVNLIPFPAFDGGHVLFIVIEKIKGSRVNPKTEAIIHNIGFIILMILMVLVTYSDIVKLF